MTDTTATVRAEWMEEEKRKIDEKIANATKMREFYSPHSALWNTWDEAIDHFLDEKENLPKRAPKCWELEPATAAQIRAMIAQLQTMTKNPERENAIAALDNAVECLNIYAVSLEVVEYEDDHYPEAMGR